MSDTDRLLEDMQIASVTTGAWLEFARRIEQRVVALEERLRLSADDLAYGIWSKWGTAEPAVSEVGWSTDLDAAPQGEWLDVTITSDAGEPMVTKAQRYGAAFYAGSGLPVQAIAWTPYRDPYIP